MLDILSQYSAYTIFEIFSGIAFVLFLAYAVHKGRKHVHKQGSFPFFVYLWRTKIGLKLMDRWGTKYRAFVQFMGWVSIGIGFIFMILIIILLLYAVFKPAPETSVSLVVPGVSIPGLGVLGFWHWIISLLIIVVIHEFSHGVVARANNIKVKNSGPAIFGVGIPLLPAAYVEPDEKEMEKASAVAKHSVLAAGPVSNIFLTAIVMFLILPFMLLPLQTAMTQPIGVTVSSVDNPDFPAYSVIDPTTPILTTAVNGVDVDDAQDILDELAFLRQGDQVLFQDDAGQEYTITAGEHPDDPRRGYLGVTFVSERRYYNQILGNIVSWLITLFKWIGTLSLAIGTINLLPVFLFDGGQMMRVYLESSMKSKEKAHALAFKISMVFIAILLLLVLYSLYFWSRGFLPI